MQIGHGIEKIDTKLAIIIDPPNQKPAIACTRVDEFIEKGGRGVLVGGSGAIEPSIFQDTVAGIVDVTTKYNTTPVWILPGHFDQIPANGGGITGVLNYAYIMGGNGNSFDIVYPQKARDFISKTLQDRKITSISTLYVLCGDPNASVSKISGILPLDLASSSVNERFLKDTNIWLHKGIECIYFESGSGSMQPVNQNTIIRTRHFVNQLKAKVSLFVSGGIKNPTHAGLFAGVADYVVIGGHFERNGVKDTNEFVDALTSNLET